MKILGWDDWLIYARRDDGVLVYTVLETTGLWFSTPHHGAYEYGTVEWRIDNSWLLDYITKHTDEFYWRECDNDTDGTYLGWGPEKDEAFTASSRAHYLCD